jgi:hypothetical protein
MTKKMHKNIGLLVGGLGLLLVSTAGATTTPLTLCGSVSSGTGGSTLYTLTGAPNPGPIGSATDNPDGTGTIMCNGFTVPLG